MKPDYCTQNEGDCATYSLVSYGLDCMNNPIPTKQVYMNVHTGSTGTRDEWFYEDEDGQTVNAVDRGEVVAIPDTDSD